MQNSQENTYVRVSLLKKRLRHRCFCEFCKIFKNAFLQSSYGGCLWKWCEFSEIFKNILFTEHLREIASVFYWRKKNMLFHSWVEQTKKIWYCCVPIRNVCTKFGSGIFWPKEIKCKTRKKHIETFYYWYRFYFMFDLDKTNTLGPNYTIFFFAELCKFF